MSDFRFGGIGNRFPELVSAAALWPCMEDCANMFGSWPVICSDEDGYVGLFMKPNMFMILSVELRLPVCLA